MMQSNQQRVKLCVSVTVDGYCIINYSRIYYLITQHFSKLPVGLNVLVLLVLSVVTRAVHVID